MLMRTVSDTSVQSPASWADAFEKVFPPGSFLPLMASYPSYKNLVISRGTGSTLFDIDGTAYTDCILGSGPLILGHADTAVVSAVKDQIEKGSTFYAATESVLRLATEIQSASPCAERMRFVTTGSEATYYALRLARAFTGRDRILKFGFGYHGTHDYGLFGLRRPVPSEAAALLQAESAGIPAALNGQVIVAEFNDVEAASSLVSHYGDDLAAIIATPILETIPPQADFLKLLQTLASDCGALLVFDEVVTGFRLAYGGAQEYFGVVPDLAALGKIIGGGYPLAAVAGRADILDLCSVERRDQDEYVFFTGTFYVNPVASAAGLATLKRLKEPGSYDRLHQLGDNLRSQLREVIDNLRIAAEVVGIGPVFNVYFTREPVAGYRQVVSSRLDIGDQLIERLIRERILVTPVKGWLSLAHTDGDLETIARGYRRCLESMIREGILE